MRIKLNHVLSPTSNLVLIAYAFLGLVLLFQPTIWHLLLLFIVDTAAMMIGVAIEWRGFRRLYPALDRYFPEFDVAELANEPEEKLSRIVSEFYRFPKRRTIYLVVTNVLKILPATLVVLFVWDQGTLFLRSIKYLFFELAFFSAFASITYLETHSKISEALRTLYETHVDRRNILLEVSAEESGGSLLRMESLAHVALLGFGVTLLCVQILAATAGEGPWFVGRLVAILCLGFLVNARVYHLSRNALFSGFSDIAKSMKGVDLGKEAPLLALHTAQELNTMERAFNTMSMRLKENQAELTEWVQYENDQSRYRTLGEVAGLVVHDLATPLHIIKFCADELLTSMPTDSALRPRLERSLEKALSLVDSLRAYLKEGHRNTHAVEFREAHPYVLRVLSLDFAEKVGKNRLESMVLPDPEVMDIKVACSRLDLIQILDNLYRNSLQNMTDHAVPEVSIRVSVLEQEDTSTGTITFRFEDKGTGLSHETFEAMTSARVGKGGFSKQAAEKGLGLRLTRRLVEQLGGKLEVSAAPRAVGTCMLLTLPLAQSTPPLQEEESIQKEA